VNEIEVSIVCPRKTDKKIDIAKELETALNRHTMLQLRNAENGEFQANPHQLDRENADEPAGQVQVEGQIRPQH
jgi:hypothetical protein